MLETEDLYSDEEVLDCGKAVNFTYYDHLVGIQNRASHTHIPEPEVANLFKKKSKKGDNVFLSFYACEKKVQCLIYFLLSGISILILWIDIVKYDTQYTEQFLFFV